MKSSHLILERCFGGKEAVFEGFVFLKLNPRGFRLPFWKQQHKKSLVQRWRHRRCQHVCGDDNTSDFSRRVIDLCSCSKDFKSQSSDCAHGPAPLQPILLLDTPRVTVGRRLLPAPPAAWRFRAVLAVQRRRRAHQHFHAVDRVPRFCCSRIPVAPGLLVGWRERVRPAENRSTLVVCSRHISWCSFMWQKAFFPFVSLFAVNIAFATTI